jgi:hypothetical protein
MSHTKTPPIIKLCRQVKQGWESEKFRRERFCKNRNREANIKHATNMISSMEQIEQFVRAHIPADQLEEMVR